MLGARAHRLPVRQLGRKGKLTPDADAFHPCPHLFFVTKAAVPQSGMRGFVHDCCGNQLRGRCRVQHEARIELAGTKRDVVPSPCSLRNVSTYPHPVEIAQNTIKSVRVMRLDKAKRVNDSAQDQLGFARTCGPDPQSIDAP